MAEPGLCTFVMELLGLVALAEVVPAADILGMADGDNC